MRKGIIWALLMALLLWVAAPMAGAALAPEAMPRNVPALEQDNEGFFLIYDQGDMEAILVNQWAEYRLMADISLMNWTPISLFHGEFDGNGHTLTIVGVAYNAPNEWDTVGIGVFGQSVGSASVHDLGVAGTIKYSTGIDGVEVYAGGVAGIMAGNSEILRCASTVDVDIDVSGGWAFGCAGGVAGVVGPGCTLADCRAEGDISAQSSDYAARAGGLVGENVGEIEHCLSTGKIFVKGMTMGYAGGIAGYNTKRAGDCGIEDCVALLAKLEAGISYSGIGRITGGIEHSVILDNNHAAEVTDYDASKKGHDQLDGEDIPDGAEKTKEFYASTMGWTFENDTTAPWAWVGSENSGYPRLWWEKVGGPPPVINNYAVSAQADPAEGGSISGGGQYARGATVALTATANDGWAFAEWMVDGVSKGSENSLALIVTGNMEVVALFDKDVEHTYPDPVHDEGRVVIADGRAFVSLMEADARRLVGKIPKGALEGRIARYMVDSSEAVEYLRLRISAAAWAVLRGADIDAFELCMDDMEARDMMLLGSCMAGMAFNNSGLGITHSIAHSLGGLFHIPHGLANAVMLPYVIRYNSFDAGVQYREIAELLSLDCASVEEGVNSLIRAVRDLNASMGIPSGIHALTVDEKDFREHLDAMAGNALEDMCTAGNPRWPSREDLRAILEEAW